MNHRTRVERAVRRAQKSAGLWPKRNRKAERVYDRWLSGIHVEKRVSAYGLIYWVHQPTGHGLIHKGRKP